MSESRVLIVIPCYNERAYIARCVRAAVQQQYPAHLLHVVVADGMSTDGTRDELEKLRSEFSNLTVLDNRARITPVALNMGLRSAEAEVKIILGAHAEPHPDFVKESVAALDAHIECGCAGGVLENTYETDEAAAIGLAMSSPFGVGNAHFRTGLRSGYVDTVAFGAYRQRVFERVGYFDEALARNQDDEFNYRVLKAGFRIWLSQTIKCKYYARTSLRKLFRQQYQYGFWKVFVNLKHHTVTTVRQVIPALYVLYLFVLPWSLLLVPSLWEWTLLPLGVYVVVSLLEALRLDRSNVHRIMAAFFLLHTGYGLGYVHGIVHFLLLGLNPHRSATITTR